MSGSGSRTKHSYSTSSLRFSATNAGQHHRPFESSRLVLQKIQRELHGTLRRVGQLDALIQHLLAELVTIQKSTSIVSSSSSSSSSTSTSTMSVAASTVSVIRSSSTRSTVNAIAVASPSSSPESPLDLSNAYTENEYPATVATPSLPILRCCLSTGGLYAYTSSSTTRTVRGLGKSFASNTHSGGAVSPLSQSYSLAIFLFRSLVEGESAFGPICTASPLPLVNLCESPTCRTRPHIYVYVLRRPRTHMHTALSAAYRRWPSLAPLGAYACRGPPFDLATFATIETRRKLERAAAVSTGSTTSPLSSSPSSNAFGSTASTVSDATAPVYRFLAHRNILAVGTTSDIPRPLYDQCADAVYALRLSLERYLSSAGISIKPLPVEEFADISPNCSAGEQRETVDIEGIATATTSMATAANKAIVVDETVTTAKPTTATTS